MGIAKNIKIAMLDKGIKTSDLSALIGLDSNVLSVKLSRDNLNNSSMEQIANALECDICLVDRKTGKIY